MEVLAKSTTDIASHPSPLAADSFPINGTDHLELYVGNAKQSAMYYMAALGFELVAYCGPETVSYTHLRREW